MFKKLYALASILLLTSVVSLFAQERENSETLRAMAERLKVEADSAKIANQSKVAEMPIPLLSIDEDGTMTEFIKFDEFGNPIFYTTYNENAAKTISTNRVYPSGGAGFNLTGKGVNLAQWDGGTILVTHDEFMNGASSRATNKDVGDMSQHSTHVAGTLIAKGNVTAAKGMAYEATLDAYDWDSDTQEMLAAAADGLVLSNHSYGPTSGWVWDSGASSWVWYGDISISNSEDYKFGYYSQDAQTVDFLVALAKDYLVFAAAGNERNDFAPPAGTWHWVWDGSNWVRDNTGRDNDGGDNGYDCIPGFAISKNVITVGAVTDIVNGWSEADDVNATDFTSYGPADDGRIKPDIVANGDGVTSCDTVSNQYREKNGTSMASPSACGSAALIVEYRRETAGSDSDYRASTLKGLILHCADEAGPADGPDYAYGWGLMNTESCVQMIEDDINTGENYFIQEKSLANGAIDTVKGKYTGDGSIKVTICWTDVPGTPPTAQPLNNRTKMLVNDIDIRLYRNGISYYPWRLDVNHPANPAARGDNTIDNVEQVYISAPTAGDYEIVVSHKGTLSANQEYAMLITGLETNEEFADTDGDGYKEIRDLGDLRRLSDNHDLWSDSYELMNDIDASDTELWNDGEGFSPIGINQDVPFTGKFKGNGYRILYLHINRPEDDYVGLFGYIDGETCEVKDLEFYYYDIKGGDYTGSIVGYLRYGHVDKCRAYGDVASDYSRVGGLAGYTWSAKITDTYAGGNVTADGNYVGGLVGYLRGTVVHKCSSTSITKGGNQVGGLIGYNYLSDIMSSYATGTAAAKTEVGGLIGYNNNGNVINCHATGNILYHIDWELLISTPAYDAGGLIGENYFSYVSNCYATGAVAGDENLGGLIGYNRYSDLLNCYSVGTVTVWDGAGQHGGLIGLESGTCDLKNCFWDTEASGVATSEGGVGKTTAVMQSKSLYENTSWNLDFVWNLEPSSYPEIEIDTNYRPQDTDGDGYRELSSLNDLRWISESYYSLDDKWEMVSDIDASASNKLHETRGFMPIGHEFYLKGSSPINVFDGHGYTISGLFIDRTGKEYVGLFGRIFSGDTVKNVILDNANIQGYRYTGALAGLNYGYVTGCKTSGTIDGTSYYVGGLLGYTSLGVVVYSVSDCNVSGSQTVGGLIGKGYQSSIGSCYAMGSVTSDGKYAGGLMALSEQDVIANCYSKGAVSGTTDIGGLIGDTTDCVVSRCYWDTQTSTLANSDGGTGKTTVEMTTKSTYPYPYWNFKTVWDISSSFNSGYPFLQIFGEYDITQQIPLSQRWNMVSSYVVPEDNSFDSVIGEVESNLFLAKNGSGKIQLPSYGITQIDDWNFEEGYLIYMNTADTLEITGQEVNSDSTISLPKGWSMISYPRSAPNLLTTAFESIDDYIFLCKDGNGKIYLPDYGINQIDSLHPGKGYLVYMIKSDILDFPVPPGGSLKPIVNENISLQSESINNPFNHTVLVHGNFNDGVEIACEQHDGIILAKASFANGKAVLAIPGDDQYTPEKDGFSEGENPVLTILSNGRTADTEIIGEITELISKEVQSELAYKTNGITEITVEAKTFNTTREISIVPNPAKENIQISLNIPNSPNIEVKLFSVTGECLLNIYSGEFIPELSATISDMPSGVYILTVETPDGIYSERVTKIK
jgi:hypothetical protein